MKYNVAQCHQNFADIPKFWRLLRDAMKNIRDNKDSQRRKGGDA